MRSVEGDESEAGTLILLLYCAACALLKVTKAKPVHLYFWRMHSVILSFCSLTSSSFLALTACANDGVLLHYYHSAISDAVTGSITTTITVTVAVTGT